MCGIFGFVGSGGNEALLRRMGDRIRHRGPDGEGYFQHGDFGMGMRRLSIIDLEGGWQPIFNEDRTLAVCYNGEIYNYVELADELRGLGHLFQTHSDTEVIVHAYEEWGTACLQRFNGMFAFALYDKRLDRLFLARDRCGQKPLYYHSSGGRLVFASEVKAILEAEWVERAVNLDAIDPYLALRYVPEPQTMFRGIFTLPAAHFMVVEHGASPKIERYWDIKLAGEGATYPSDDEALDMVEQQLRESVRLVMRSDVPVGAYLSAGVDSSLVVALMRELHDDLHTYSIGFNSPGDETKDAAETARLLGTKHHEIQCAPEDFALLPKVVYHMDRPVGDALILAFYRLAEETAKDLRVVVGGEGADEIFAGYSFHKVIQIVETYRRLVPSAVHHGLAMPALKATPWTWLNNFFEFPAALGEQGKARLVDFLGGYDRRSLFANYMSLKTLWGEEARSGLYTEGFRARATDAWVPPVRDESGPFLDRLLKLQWDEWLQDWCIIRQDKNTMAHSLEYRLPFLDHHLIELLFTLPPHLKARGMKDKIIERRLAAKLLPPQVVNRPKNPFFLPMEFFFEHPEINDLISMTLDPERIRKRGYFRTDVVSALRARMETREFVILKQVMALVILELWHIAFIDGESM